MPPRRRARRGHDDLDVGARRDRDQGDARPADALGEDGGFGLDRLGEQDVEAVRADARDAVGLARLLADRAADAHGVLVRVRRSPSCAAARSSRPPAGRSGPRGRPRDGARCPSRCACPWARCGATGGGPRSGDGATGGAAARGPGDPRGRLRCARRRAHRGDRRGARSGDGVRIGRWAGAAAVSPREDRSLRASLARTTRSGLVGAASASVGSRSRGPGPPDQTLTARDGRLWRLAGVYAAHAAASRSTPSTSRSGSEP